MTRHEEPTGPIGPVGPGVPGGWGDPEEPVGCPRAPEAGAYLLGSLTPAERADYAAHLATCQICLGEVGQLAGLPGLLARSPGPPLGARLPSAGRHQAEPPDWLAGESGEPGPVEAALAEIRQQRARRRALTAAALVLVAAVGVGGTALASRTFAGPTTGVSAAAELPLPMEPVGGAKVTAALALADRPWGTEVVMRCRYQGAPDRSPVYTLVATAADGSTTELARWTAIPDQDVVLATATDLDRRRLSNLEVRNQAGTVVLRTAHI